LGHSAFHPNRESERILRRLLPAGRLDQLKRREPLRYRSIVSRLVRHDLREISRHTDYVICYWNRAAARGAGTKGEVTLAKFLNKPVYLVARAAPENIPGWVLGCVTTIFPSFAALKNFLKKLHHPLKKPIQRRQP
ncbi:MAG: hypothetical protein WD295_06920, partial [Bacteroidota bacterium]